MCNAWNHPPGCICGWGGDGHRSGGWISVHPTSKPAEAPYSESGLTTLRCKSNDFCRPTNCQKCGGEVFFIRHNGGSVWVDELGWPWPKHGCFDDSSSIVGNRFIADMAVRYSEVEVKPKLGRVIKRIYSGFDHIYLIAAHDGRLSSLSAPRTEDTVFTDLVVIRYTDDKIFLEDSRCIPARVRNYELTEETMQDYLVDPDEIIYVPIERPARKISEMVTCEHCRKRILMKNFRNHLKKAHGIVRRR